MDLEDVMTKVAVAGVLMLSIFILAIFSGFLLWLIYPVVFGSLFAWFVEQGMFPAKLSLWQSVCTVWLFGILIKSNQTNNNKGGN